MSRTLRTDSNNVIHRTKVHAESDFEHSRKLSVDSNNRENLRGIQERAVTIGIKKASGPTAESLTAAKDML